MTKARKERWIGLDFYNGFTLGMLRKMTIEKYRDEFTKRWDAMAAKGKLAPFLTNMGRIPDLSFEGPPERANLLAPANYPPSVAFGLSGYRGTLTLDTATFPRNRRTAEGLIGAIDAELP